MIGVAGIAVAFAAAAVAAAGAGAAAGAVATEELEAPAARLEVALWRLGREKKACSGQEA